MPEISHPVFGSVGRAERPEVPIQPPSAAQPPQASAEPPEEPRMAPADLRSLVECGKVTDTVEIDGQRFRMSTLSDDDQEAVFRRFSAPLEDAGGFMELRRTVVAMAVEAFNGRPFEDLHAGEPGDAKDDAFGQRLALVRRMQGQVVDRLYAFYDELLKRSRQRIEPEQVKN